MDFVSLIERKRDGGALSEIEIREITRAYAANQLPDYQMSALAMAIVCRGMTESETTALTEAMLQSGDRLSWKSHDRPIVDKHSTGGIGDKVSLVLAPLLAACDVWVPMVSGRGLGATGGTLDKLQSIGGLQVDLSIERFQQIVTEVGCAIVAANDRIAPADRRLYALRDVTGTVPSVPLITASILSKKLAEGLDALILDVKAGSGAFMKSLDAARELARSLVSTSARLGVPAVAWITDMNQPLGRMVGNACEVREAIEILQGRGGNHSIRQLSMALGAAALKSCHTVADDTSALARLTRALDSGDAYEVFERMVAAQKGDLKQLAPQAPTRVFASSRSGYVHYINGEILGRVVVSLGGGRRKIGDSIDPRVGMEVCARLGERIESGEPLLKLHVHQEPTGEQLGLLRHAFVIGDEEGSVEKLLIERIEGIPHRREDVKNASEAMLMSIDTLPDETAEERP